MCCRRKQKIPQVDSLFLTTVLRFFPKQPSLVSVQHRAFALRICNFISQLHLLQTSTVTCTVISGCSNRVP